MKFLFKRQHEIKEEGYRLPIFVAILLLVLSFCPVPSLAQELSSVPPVLAYPATEGAAATVDTQPAVSQEAAGRYEQMSSEALSDLDTIMRQRSLFFKPSTKPSEIGSLFYTLWQHALLQDAKRLFRTRPPSDSEMAAAGDKSAVEAARPRGIREISLGGIVHRGSDDWIIWMNGQRMAPDALPKEVIDIKVTDRFVDLKWFDAYTNLIYPVRLRPHERFNLDSRIFLPGAGVEIAGPALQ